MRTLRGFKTRVMEPESES